MSWIQTLASWNYQNDFLIIKNHLLLTTGGGEEAKKNFSLILQHHELESLNANLSLDRKILKRLCTHADLHFPKSKKVAHKISLLLTKIFNSTPVEKIKFPDSSCIYPIHRSILKEPAVLGLLKKFPPIQIKAEKGVSHLQIFRQFKISFQNMCVEVDLSKIHNEFTQLYFKTLKNQNNPLISLDEWLSYYTSARRRNDTCLIRAYETLICELSEEVYDISFVRDMANAQVDQELISRFCSICIRHPRSCIELHINEALMSKVIYRGWEKKLPEMIKFNFIYSWLTSHAYTQEQLESLLKLVDFSRIYRKDLEDKVLKGLPFMHFLSLEQKNQLCDLCIHIKDKTFHLQSKQLYSHSTYFEALNHPWKENHGDYIELDATDLEVFESFYYFLKWDVLPQADFNKIYALYQYAHRIQATQLRAACIKELFPLLKDSSLSNFFNYGYSLLLEHVNIQEQNDVIDDFIACYFSQRDLVQIEKRDPLELIQELQDLSQSGFELFLFLHPQVQEYLYHKNTPHALFKTSLKTESIKFYLICQRLENHPEELKRARFYFKYIDMSRLPRDYLCIFSDYQSTSFSKLSKKLISMAYRCFFIGKVDVLKKLFLKKIKQVILGVQLFSKPTPLWANVILKGLEFSDWERINPLEDSEWLFLAVEFAIKKHASSSNDKEKSFLKDKAVDLLYRTEKYAPYLYLKHRAFFDKSEDPPIEHINKRNSLFFRKAPFENYETLHQLLKEDGSHSQTPWIIHVENFLQEVSVTEGNCYFHHLNLIWVMRYALIKLQNMKGLRKKAKLLHEEISSYALPFDQ